MKCDSISENLLFSTLKLERLNGSCGTGFIFNFHIKDKSIPVLITNQHVINYNPYEEIILMLHLKNQDGSTNSNFKTKISFYWYFHTDKDLCFTFFQPIIDQVKKLSKKEVYYSAIDENWIWAKNKLEKLSALEKVTMIGYPIGLYDIPDNLPILRQGSTSSHPFLDFNNKGIGLVDMACFPGSSGSPIFVLNEGSYHSKSSGVFIGNRVIFLGILFSAPVYSAKGILVAKDIPTSQNIVPSTAIMTNLGYYIKAEEILTFKCLLENMSLK